MSVQAGMATRNGKENSILKRSRPRKCFASIRNASTRWRSIIPFITCPQRASSHPGRNRSPMILFSRFKAPQVITHLKRLKNVDEETEYLFRTLSVLDRKLGPVLFQFPKSFHADPPALKDFLALIPGTMSCAFEFRSPSWLDA